MVLVYARNIYTRDIILDKHDVTVSVVAVALKQSIIDQRTYVRENTSCVRVRFSLSYKNIIHAVASRRIASFTGIVKTQPRDTNQLKN